MEFSAKVLALICLRVLRRQSPVMLGGSKGLSLTVAPPDVGFDFSI
jgi:hypothetical protein